MKHLAKAGLVAIFMFLSVLYVSAPTEAQFAETGTRVPGGRLFEALALSEAQKAEIDSLTALSRERLRSLRGQLKEQREALRETVEHQSFDDARVREIAQGVANLQTELLVARAYLMHQILSLLTDEQKAKLAELRTERREKRRGNPSQTQG